MTFLASTATNLWNQVQTWTGRANNAWGSSRVWNSGSSFETDLGNMTTDRNAWQGRANSAWGASRVWNSGSSFETDLGNMTADRNAWQGRANSAWGASRVWNSGESWEAAYNRVLPAGLTGYSAASSGSFTGQIAALTVGITGQYLVAWNNACSTSGSYGWVNFTLNVAGANVATNIPTAVNNQVTSYGGGYWQGTISAGQQVKLSASQAGSSTSSNQGGSLVAYFIPTPTYPH